jgi:hypothetical protein
MKTTTAVIVAAAVSGLFAGAGAVRASSTTSTNGRSVSRTTATTFAGAKAQNMDDAAGKHDCKGANSCKGQGGCKSGDNGCKGQNSCKGKGGCKTNGAAASQPAKV